MRVIAITKKCLECEKELILSAVEKEDKVLFFDNEEELIKSKDYTNVDILFGEPEYSTVQLMDKLRWIQMSFAGANKYTSVSDFPNSITITSASGAYGYVISEYIITSFWKMKQKVVTIIQISLEVFCQMIALNIIKFHLITEMI